MSKGRITREELHPSILDMINSGSGGSSNLRVLKNSVELTTQTKTVNIGISGYNKNTDTLMVYKNSTYMEEGVSYSITSDSLSVTTLEDDWKLSSNKVVFNFVVFKNAPSTNSIDFYNKEEIDVLLQDALKEIKSLKDEISIMKSIIG